MTTDEIDKIQEHFKFQGELPRDVTIASVHSPIEGSPHKHLHVYLTDKHLQGPHIVVSLASELEPIPNGEKYYVGWYRDDSDNEAFAPGRGFVVTTPYNLHDMRRAVEVLITGAMV